MFYKKIKYDKINFNKVKKAYKKVFIKYSPKQYFEKNLYKKAVLIFKLYLNDILNFIAYINKKCNVKRWKKFLKY